MNDAPGVPLRSPGVRFPPPTVFVAGWLLGWLLESRVERIRLVGASADRWPLVIGGTLFLAAGLVVIAWGLLTFFRARTAVMPHHSASRLVTHGPYRFTRNPMYLGMTLLHLGLALRANMGWPLLLLPLVLYTLYRLVISREERYLTSAFGAAYEDYRRRVRRWI
jgi:protein-S-isoprenylcysteine O-methyltransferase Ste14